jgi:hypothetical protein
MPKSEPPRPLNGPPDTDLAGLVAELLVEVDAELDSDRYAFYRPAGPKVRAYQAASLRHCCELLAEIEAARIAGLELTMRALGRSHIEAFFVGLYLHLGGKEALDAMAGGYLANQRAQYNDLVRYNDRLRTQIRSARRRNKQIRRINAGLKIRYGDDAEQHLIPFVAEPDRPLVTVLPVLETDPGDAVEQSLPLTEIMTRTERLLAEREGGDPSLAVIYALGFRGFSSVGTHTTLIMLEHYLPHNPLRAFIRSRRPMVPTMASSTVGHTSLHMTAALIRIAFELQGRPAPAAQRLLDLYEAAPSTSDAALE